MSATASNLSISVLFIEEDDGWWSAQCLEYDIAAQAKTLTDLRREFERVLKAQLMFSEGEPFEGIGPAPQEYWERFAASDLSLTSLNPVILRDDKRGHEISTPQLRVADKAAA